MRREDIDLTKSWWMQVADRKLEERRQDMLDAGLDPDNRILSELVVQRKIAEFKERQAAHQAENQNARTKIVGLLHAKPE